MTETEFITAALNQYREALTALPEQFAAAQRTSDRKIDALCEEAGIMGAVQRERDTLKAAQKQIQQQADLLSGRINMLEEIHRQFHLAPIPEGVTHKYGIELAPLDPETRLKVMHGQEGDDWEDTIRVLGGDPDYPDWDGTWQEEDESEEVALPVEMVVPDAPLDDGEAFTGDTLIDAIMGTTPVPEEEPEPGPEDSDLDEIELAEIEARVEDGTATPEDMERAIAMFERARSAEG